MNEKQREFLIQEGFKEREDKAFGGTEWYKPFYGGIEFVYSNHSMLAHFTNVNMYMPFLSVDAIAIKLDYYTNKLNDVDML